MALIFIIIAFVIGMLWVISNIRVSNYYKEAMEDYNRVQYELEKYKEDYRYLVHTIENRDKENKVKYRPRKRGRLIIRGGESK